MGPPCPGIPTPATPTPPCAASGMQERKTTANQRIPNLPFRFGRRQPGKVYVRISFYASYSIRPTVADVYWVTAPPLIVPTEPPLIEMVFERSVKLVNVPPETVTAAAGA